MTTSTKKLTASTVFKYNDSVLKTIDSFVDADNSAGDAIAAACKAIKAAVMPYSSDGKTISADVWNRAVKPLQERAQLRAGEPLTKEDGTPAAMCDVARKWKQRAAGLFQSDYAMQISAPVSKATAESKARTARNEKRQAKLVEIADVLVKEAQRADADVAVVFAEKLARKTSADERKDLRAAFDLHLKQQEAAHLERVQVAKSTISKFVSGCKGKDTSTESLAILEQMAALIPA